MNMTLPDSGEDKVVEVRDQTVPNGTRPALDHFTLKFSEG